jgi:hypothetical protein
VIDIPVLATCGYEIKYDLSYRYPYHKVVAEVLARTGAKLYHIGPLSQVQLERVQHELKNAGIAKDQWIHITYVSSVWKAMEELRVDLYINSFPLRGARVAVEIMGSGTPAVWHLSDKLHQSADLHLSYPEASAWSTPDELVEIVLNLTPDWLEKQRNAARTHYKRVHHPIILENMIKEDFLVTKGADMRDKRLFAFEFQHLEDSWHRLFESTQLGTRLNMLKFRRIVRVLRGDRLPGIRRFRALIRRIARGTGS